MLVFSVIITGTSLPPVPLLAPFIRKEPTLPKWGAQARHWVMARIPTMIDRVPSCRDPGSRDGTPLAARRPAHHRPAPERAVLVEGLLRSQQGQKTLYMLPDGHTRLRLKSKIQT